MAEDSNIDKRRRQNRDSQRRFRERNKAWRFRSISLENAPVPAINPAAPLLPSPSSDTSDHATSYVSGGGGDDSRLLCPETQPPAGGEGVLYRQPQQFNSSNPVLQMNFQPYPANQFSLDEMSILDTNKDASYHQQQTFEAVRRVPTASKDMLLSPPKSLRDADLRIHRPEEILQPRRRTSASRAEQMISDVEDLYEFGIVLAIFPEDPTLCNALRKMKERFRSLAQLGGSSGQTSTDSEPYDGSSQDSDSGE